MLNPAGLDVAEHLLPIESSERIPCFALLPCTAFVLPSKLSWSQPLSCGTSTFLILSHSGRMNKQLCGAQLPAGLSHDSRLREETQCFFHLSSIKMKYVITFTTSCYMEFLLTGLLTISTKENRTEINPPCIFLNILFLKLVNILLKKTEKPSALLETKARKHSSLKQGLVTQKCKRFSLYIHSKTTQLT